MAALPEGSARRAAAAGALGEALAAASRPEDAAVALLAAGRPADALAQYCLAGEWRMALALAGVMQAVTEPRVQGSWMCWRRTAWPASGAWPWRWPVRLGSQRL